MSFVIAYNGGFVLKDDGCNFTVKNPEDASFFNTKEDAMNARPGHHKDMGGDGFKGAVITYSYAKELYKMRIEMGIIEKPIRQDY